MSSSSKRNLPGLNMDPVDSGVASSCSTPGSSEASGSRPPADARCTFCQRESSDMHIINCSHTLCASCIFGMLRQRTRQAPLCVCPICRCPITFVDQLGAVKEVNPDLSLIKDYNSDFLQDIRTQIHRKKDALSTSQSQASGSSKLINIPWKVIGTGEINDPSCKIWKSFKSDKSAETKLETKNLPTISFKSEDIYNHHAFKIMHTLNHKNLLRIQAAEHSKKRPGSIDTLLEQTSGKLLSICGLYASTDGLGHFPSWRFQSAVREMFEALGFLNQNSLYHGNLSWETTFYIEDGEDLYTVKLTGFISKDDMTMAEAQFNDRKCLAAMLRHHVDIVDRSPNLNIFCGHLTGLIRDLERKDVTPNSIRNNTFFWDEEKRISFYTKVVSLRVKVRSFELMVEHRGICALPWNVTIVGFVLCHRWLR